MSSTVRNAKSVLQKARLMVAQQKNQYDLRGCISALDTCMQDDFVCGSDYENCLDPTGKYIVNGEIVNGSMPGQSGATTSSGLYSTWSYTKDSTTTNVWTDGNLSDYIATKVTNKAPTASTTDMADYLRAKIGYSEEGKNYGMCAAVLNKCQDITYDGKTTTNKKFKYDNEVIKEYLQRTLIQIKAQQDKVLEEYADGCISDVASCLSQNNYNYSYSYSTSATTNNQPTEIAINACMSQIKTCRNITTGSTTTDMTSIKNWLDKAIGTSYACTAANGTLQSAACIIERNGTTYSADLLTGTLYKLTNDKLEQVSTTECTGTNIGKVVNKVCTLETMNVATSSLAAKEITIGGSVRTFSPSVDAPGLLIASSAVTKAECTNAATTNAGLRWSSDFGRCVYQ